MKITNVLKIALIILIVSYILFGARFYILLLQHQNPVMICSKETNQPTDMNLLPPEPSLENCSPQPEPTLREKAMGALYTIFFWPLMLAVTGFG